jgi:hypothetical protein
MQNMKMVKKKNYMNITIIFCLLAGETFIN